MVSKRSCSGVSTAEAPQKRQRRVRALAADPDPARAGADASRWVHRSCRVRLTGQTEWLTAVVRSIKGNDRQTVELEWAEESAAGVGVLPRRLTLDSQCIHVEREVAWGPEEVDLGDEAGVFRGPGGSVLTPMLLFEPLGRPEEEADVGQLLALSFHSGRYSFVEREEVVPMVLHMWRRRTPAALKKAVTKALDAMRELEATGLRAAKRSLISKRIGVYWPDDDMWYCGRVLEYDAKEGKHEVLYDDLAKEMLELGSEIVHVFRDEEEEAEFDEHARGGTCFHCGGVGRLVPLRVEPPPAPSAQPALGNGTPSEQPPPTLEKTASAAAPAPAPAPTAASAKAQSRRGKRKKATASEKDSDGAPPEDDTGMPRSRYGAGSARLSRPRMSLEEAIALGKQKAEAARADEMAETEETSEGPGGEENGEADAKPGLPVDSSEQMQVDASSSAALTADDRSVAMGVADGLNADAEALDSRPSEDAPPCDMIAPVAASGSAMDLADGLESQPERSAHAADSLPGSADAVELGSLPESHGAEPNGAPAPSSALPPAPVASTRDASSDDRVEASDPMRAAECTASAPSSDTAERPHIPDSEGVLGDEDAQGLEKAGVAAADSGNMLQCRGCLDRFHFSCLDKSLETQKAVWSTWRCVACKRCESCGADGTKLRLAMCDVCDRGYHIGCLDPPLKLFPFRAFKCPHCVRCSSCGTTTAKAWTRDYARCVPCGKLFKERRYCPICLVVYTRSDAEMVQCDKCNFWVHGRCDGLGEAELAALADSGRAYTCPNCRGERTATLMLQVLDQLVDEDRERFFTDPVPIEYALHTKYHSVVDTPMDLATMRGKVRGGEYGSLHDGAIEKFRADFELIISNALAFHRPNERCHLMAKRLQRFGQAIFETTFPWSQPTEAAEGTGDAGSAPAAAPPAADKAPPAKQIDEAEVHGALASPWHRVAKVIFDCAEPPLPAAKVPDSCFVCGGLAAEEVGVDAQLLHCMYCAEAFHPFCTPAPCPVINEETLAQWSCPRCRVIGHSEKAKQHDRADGSGKSSSDAQSAPGGAGTLAGYARCSRCDKLQVKKLATKSKAPAEAPAAAAGPVTSAGASDAQGSAQPAYAGLKTMGTDAPAAAPAASGKDETLSASQLGLWMCYECRMCEGCGSTVGRGGFLWSSDGVWCQHCSPAGVEGRYCGVCATPYEDTSEEAATMVQCETCLLWVHQHCDGMSAEEYTAYTEGRPGYENYECQDCRAMPTDNPTQQWRYLQRLVARIQQKRVAFSPELLRSLHSDPGVSKHAARSAAVQRWCAERAKAGAAWASWHPQYLANVDIEPSALLPSAIDLADAAAARGLGSVPVVEPSAAEDVNDDDSFADDSSADEGAVEFEEGGTSSRPQAPQGITGHGPLAGADALSYVLEGAVKQSSPSASPAAAVDSTASAGEDAAASSGQQSRALVKTEVDSGSAAAASVSAPNGELQAECMQTADSHATRTNGCADSTTPADAASSSLAPQSASKQDTDPVRMPALGTYRCAFCQGENERLCGRLVPVAPGGWVHVNCALWSSEVFEKDLGILHQVPMALRRSRKSTCTACGRVGASIRCFSKRCTVAYHFECARESGCYFSTDSQRGTYCPAHAPPRAIRPLPARISRSISVHSSLRLTQVSPAALQAVSESSEDETGGGSHSGGGRALLQVGALRILSFGRPQPGRPQFFERRLIFPLGFTSVRRFWDVRHPWHRTHYVCEIREAGGLPHFVISLESDRSVSFSGGCAGKAWAALMAQLPRRQQQPGRGESQLEGLLFFGLSIPAVAQLVEQLPGAKACEGFVPTFAKPEAMQKVPPLPKNPSGCARAEPFCRRTSAFKSQHSVYFRPFINRGALPTREEVPADDKEERRDGKLLRKREGESRSLGHLERGGNATAQALQRLRYNVEVKRSAIHNWGLFTTRTVPKDAMVVEYKGEEIRSMLADAKEKRYEGGALKGQGGDCYMFRVDADLVLDATVRGNVARFINHCCTPNCYSKVIEVDGRKHIVIFAQRDLEIDEEIVYDYKFPVEKAKIACHCGSPKCLGVMN